MSTVILSGAKDLSRFRSPHRKSVRTSNNALHDAHIQQVFIVGDASNPVNATTRLPRTSRARQHNST